MSLNFFDRLETELASLAREGAHLDGWTRRIHRRVRAIIRRSLVVAVLAVVLAASLLSEFPASATGHAVARDSAHRAA